MPGGRGERADDRIIGQALDDQTGGEGASRRATGNKHIHMHDDWPGTSVGLGGSEAL